MKVLAAIIFGLPILALMAVLLAIPVAWAVMLLLGVAHSMEPAIPALGYGLTFVLVLIARLVIPTSSHASASSK